MPEKEIAMKTTKIMKAVVLVYAALFCLNTIPAAAHAAHAQALDARGTDAACAPAAVQDGELGVGKALAALMSYVVTPWGFMPTALTIYAGLGTIGGAILPADHDDLEMNEALVLARTK
jgi:hypothetical protein